MSDYQKADATYKKAGKMLLEFYDNTGHVPAAVQLMLHADWVGYDQHRSICRYKSDCETIQDAAHALYFPAMEFWIVSGYDRNRFEIAAKEKSDPIFAIYLKALSEKAIWAIRIRASILEDWSQRRGGEKHYGELVELYEALSLSPETNFEKRDYAADHSRMVKLSEQFGNQQRKIKEADAAYQAATRQLAETTDAQVAGSAIATLERLAQAQHPAALNKLGTLAFTGQHQSRNVEEAVNLWLEASRQGSLEAFFNLLANEKEIGFSALEKAATLSSWRRILEQVNKSLENQLLFVGYLIRSDYFEKEMQNIYFATAFRQLHRMTESTYITADGKSAEWVERQLAMIEEARAINKWLFAEIDARNARKRAERAAALLATVIAVLSIGADDVSPNADVREKLRQQDHENRMRDLRQSIHNTEMYGIYDAGN